MKVVHHKGTPPQFKVGDTVRFICRDVPFKITRIWPCEKANDCGGLATKFMHCTGHRFRDDEDGFEWHDIFGDFVKIEE